MTRGLSIFLTIGLQVLASTLVHANEINMINLPNGQYHGVTRQLEIMENRARIELSETEIIDMELQRGIGPVFPGNFLYMDKDENDPQVIVGNCKQLTKITCFFEVTEPEKAADGNTLAGRFLIYEIEIVNNLEFLSVNIQKFRHIEGQERQLLKSLNEDFFPAQSKQSQTKVETKGLK